MKIVNTIIQKFTFVNLRKTVFYDESSRVPFIISWKGITEKETSDVLLNTGTDILPTLCIQAAFRLDGSFFLVATLIPLLGRTEGNRTSAAANSC